jgi:hypothetical protein
MRKWILLLLASGFVVAAAPASQATPLLPVGPLASTGVANDAVLVHHKWWHKKKKADRGRHLGWVKGKHKGWR